MSDSEKRHCWEAYKKLAQTDFKCLENEINKINSGKNDPKALFEKLLEIIECEGDWVTQDETVKSYYKMWYEWKKNGAKMDPDDSTGKNPFSRAVYYLLWGKKIIDSDHELTREDDAGKEVYCGIYEDGWGSFSISYIFPAESESGSKTMLLGSDTMNTLKSYEEELENLLNTKNESEDVNELCRKCHQLGNFVLVPAYYNSNRGARDQIDIAFDRLLKGNIDGGFKGQTKLKSSKKGTKEEKEEVADRKFYRWDKEHFSQYINMFFLWDYVKPESDKKTYVVKDLKSEKGDQVTNNTHVDKDNVEQYITNANAYIERRSIFMAAMLAIAVEFKGVKITEDAENGKTGEWKNRDKWEVSDIYKYIVQEVFLTNKTYSDYNEVLELIKGAVKKTLKEDEEPLANILSILDDAKESISKLAQD